VSRTQILGIFVPYVSEIHAEAMQGATLIQVTDLGCWVRFWATVYGMQVIQIGLMDTAIPRARCFAAHPAATHMAQVQPAAHKLRRSCADVRKPPCAGAPSYTTRAGGST
jgi:hypothetical protein